jgi:hypothetical protein
LKKEKGEIDVGPISGFDRSKLVSNTRDTNKPKPESPFGTDEQTKRDSKAEGQNRPVCLLILWEQAYHDPIGMLNSKQILSGFSGAAKQ